MGKYHAWLLLILCNLFWAGNYIFGKYVVAEMSPLWLTFSRWVLALMFLLPIAHLIEKPNWKQVANAWFPLACMGALGVIAFNVLLYSALAFTSPTNAALVTALNPGVIVVSSIFLLREKITRIQMTGFLLSLAGVWVILTRGNLGQILQTDYNRGDLLVIAAVLAWTVYSIIGKRLAHIPPITATAASTLLAVLMMVPFVMAQGMDWTNLGPLAITGLLYIVVFPSVCSFMFWNISVRVIGASQAGIFINLIPVFTALISVMLGDKITGAQVWGGLLVLTGVCLATGITIGKRQGIPQQSTLNSEREL